MKQAENSYQPATSLYCVAATYTMEPTLRCRIFNCKDTQVDVYNRARRGGIYGEESGGHLVGVIPDVSDPSKAAVGPWFIPQFLYGPYWIVAVGKYSELVSGAPKTDFTYEWAIITGGPPNRETSSGKCIPGVGFQNEGFWIFTRMNDPGDVIIGEIEKKAEALGLDTSELIKVKHEGCTY